MTQLDLANYILENMKKSRDTFKETFNLLATSIKELTSI